MSTSFSSSFLPLLPLVNEKVLRKLIRRKKPHFFLPPFSGKLHCCESQVGGGAGAGVAITIFASFSLFLSPLSLSPPSPSPSPVHFLSNEGKRDLLALLLLSLTFCCTLVKSLKKCTCKNCYDYPIFSTTHVKPVAVKREHLLTPDQIR